MTFPDLMNATAADLELYFADKQDRWTPIYRRRVILDGLSPQCPPRIGVG